jgi:hypothetical protein
MVTVLVASLLSLAQAKDCSYQAEQYVNKMQSWPGQFMEVDTQGNHVYRVRANDHGGDAAYAVTVRSENCELVEIRLLWTE